MVQIRKDLLENLFKIVKSYDNEKKVEWITVKGHHIPIEEGQDRNKVIKEHIEDLKAKGGYTDENKSSRSVAAELEGKDNITNLSKKLKISSSELKDLYSVEWHHTNKNFRKTKYYYTDAYLDLQKQGKISKKTIDKYDLDQDDIRGLTDSWKKLEKKLENDKPTKLIEDIKKKYKDNLLDDIFEEIETKKRKKSLAAEEISRFIDAVRSGEEDKERLEKVVEFWHKIAVGKAKK